MPSLAPYSGSLPIASHSSSSSTILDVEHSFLQAVERYTLLDRAASSLASDLASLPPSQILLRSNQLARMQQDLAGQDDQLIAILTLAGAEIADTPFVKDYQKILAKVILVCDQIAAQTALIKKKLVESLDNTRNP
ncbi:MAG: hypothetical protein K0A99_07690 [Desulfoarculaceae bacterium]|nr:hypothetical protein [Desulfoarculaceae bacterium]